jgi:hypothetical protein
MPGALLAFLQLFFALTWVVYVIYLPGLAKQVGFEPRHVAWLLIMDQLIFLACDWAAGVYADRIARKFGRIGGWMATVTLVSCAAFIALPVIAPNVGKTPFFALTILWSATSSALRAPPFAIVARYAGAARAPWISCAYLFGMGLASAFAPYLAIELRSIDPRIPFTLASVGLAAFTFALARAERGLLAPRAADAAPAASPGRAPIPLLALVILLFAFGYQVHFAMNSSAAYLRFAGQADLPYLMPVFWIGFNVALLPAAMLVKRQGGSAILVVGGTVGVAALGICARAPSLEPLVAAQALSGAAWGLALTSAFALALGRPGREGTLTGILFSTLALAALVRIFLLAANVQGDARIGPQLENLPFVAWALAAFLMATVAFTDRKEAAP